MRYVEARVDEFFRDEAYRIYVSRSLQLIPQNKYLNKGYEEIFDFKESDSRSSEEITLDVMKKAGLKFEE